MMGQETKLVEQFDKDGDGRLNATERQAARDHIKAEAANWPNRMRDPGSGRQEEPAKPGVKLSLADVKSYPDKPFYDPTIVRTLFLEFESDDWAAEMAVFNNTDVEMPAQLTVDGKIYPDVGVHYRGLSSFMMVPADRKRSLNISLDYVHDGQDIDSYNTFNLLNSHEDPSYLRSILYYQIAREYIPAPKANFVRVVINGENWGVYVNVQQFNKDFVKDNYDTKKGARWKVPGNPGAQGSLAYLGDDVENYKRIYSIKSKDDPKDWARFIEMTKVLNETPPDQLEAKLSPLLDIDGALKFLALDITLINNDGYWIRSSDYSIYMDKAGQFHVLPQDANETFALPGGPGFGGGPGGRGRFGPGMIMASPIVTHGDQNGDGKLSKTEMGELAVVWFDKLDPDKTGKLNQDQFVQNFGAVLPPPPGFGPSGAGPGGPGGDPGGPGRFGPAMFIGPGFFAVVDVNKDGSLTREELVATFTKWAVEWDTEKVGSLNQELVQTGLNAALPQPSFGGGRGQGGPDGRRGPGGPQGRDGGRQANRALIEGVQLDPLYIANDQSKALAYRLLAVPALRERFLRYVRDIAQNQLDWNTLGPIAEQYHALIAEDMKRDPRKLDSIEDFEISLTENIQNGGGFGPQETISIKNFADQRRDYLLNYPEIKKLKN